MVRHLAAQGLNLLIVALIVLAGLIGWSVTSFNGPGPLEKEVIVEIPRGTRLDGIAERLKQAGAVSSASLFRIGVRYLGLTDKLKFGVYKFAPGVSMREAAQQLAEGGADARYRVTFGLRKSGLSVKIADLLADPASKDAQLSGAERLAAVEASKSSIVYRVTIPEGWTSYQIVNGLKIIEQFKGEVKEIPAEGSLAPDTYEFHRGSERAALLKRMADAQARILARAWEERAPDLPLKTPKEALILASIVEKETGVAAERPVVASVFINRLRRKMRLETDPTVIYGLTLGKDDLGRDLTRADLRRKTAYNTYRIPGLPPTPIANPGQDSIMAVLHPAETDYLYFVADGTGGHAFATTLEEHKRNKARWDQIKEERARAEEQN
ncbi:MAG: endolytic transglycosylase MltG [Alphaproteobacteria bacterium]|nr:MAG: endolytic transglycosylase MltG [Alphaproteobacteria bacterium]